MTEQDSNITPAKYEEGGARPFAQSLPWKGIVVAILFIGLFVGGYLYYQEKRTNALRDQVAQNFASSVRPAIPKIKAFESKINTWVMRASKNPNPKTWADPKLNINGLHGAQGVYLRILEANTTDTDKIAVATQLADEDAITNCLGFAPLTLKSLYAVADLTGDSWLNELSNTHDYMRLSVMQEQLANRTSRDLPVLLNVVQSDYLLLAIVRGESRFEDPVDVYMWDIKRNKPLLRTRTKAKGMLVSVKIALDGTPRGAAKPLPKKSGAADCSIASQIREAAGREAVGFKSDVPEAADPVEAEDDKTAKAEDNASKKSAEPDATDKALADEAPDDTKPIENVSNSPH